MSISSPSGTLGTLGTLGTPATVEPYASAGINAEVKGYPESADNTQASRPSASSHMPIARPTPCNLRPLRPPTNQNRNCPLSPFASRPSLASPPSTGLHPTNLVDECSFTANSGTPFGRSLRSPTFPSQWLVGLLFSPHLTSNLIIIGNPVATPSITTFWENVE